MGGGRHVVWALWLFAAACRDTPGPAITRPAVGPGTDDPEWHYDGVAGPNAWGDLSPAFASCGDGRMQSPVDLDQVASAANVPRLDMRFPPASLRIAHHEHVADGINNGHTIQITSSGGSTLTLGDDAYDLVQYHFHEPSEHTIAGRRFAMEMHLVHRARSGALAVVGVLIEPGIHNAAFEPIWSNLPDRKGVETHYEHIMVDVDALLPRERASVRYAGSLTTPPCSEGVRWVVLTKPIVLGEAQLDAFRQRIRNNARPRQPLNGRTLAADALP